MAYTLKEVYKEPTTFLLLIPALDNHYLCWPNSKAKHFLLHVLAVGLIFHYSSGSLIRLQIQPEIQINAKSLHKNKTNNHHKKKKKSIMEQGRAG